MVAISRVTVAFLICLAWVSGSAIRAGTFVVNTGNDIDDGDCSVSHCSFREAINASNLLGGLDEIHFALPGQGPYIISWSSGFPQITDSVIIDGYTQPGSDREKGLPNVVLTGDYWSGLVINAPAVTVRGLVIQGFNQALRVYANHAVIQGNFIGTNVQGDDAAAVRNSYGVWLQFAHDALVGGTAPGDRNLISGNSTGSGIYCTGSTGVVIQGNLVGVDLAGRRAIPNLYGIYMTDDCRDGVIGGPGAGEGNLVAGNTDYEIRIGGGTSGTATHRIVVQGNVIGTDRTGTLDLGSTYGLTIGHAENTVAGGPNPGEGNVIGHNAKGIVSGLGMPPSTFSGNRIFASGTPFQETLGIDVGNNGVSPNDHCDVDGVQNFPVLTSATSTTGAVTIQGQIDSVASQEYTLEFFANRECDPLGYGEGEAFLGRGTVVTDASCAGAFSVNLPVAVPHGMAITATATGPGGSTSEFSACLSAAGPPGSGRVPDGSDLGSSPLTVSREGSGDLALSWSESCHPNDADYEVYEGELGMVYSHAPVTCSTAGATTHTFTPAAGARYYLVVPTNGSIEGSYGLDSDLAERPSLAGACHPQQIGVNCP